MLKETMLDGTIYDKVFNAIERIKTMAPIAYNIYGLYTVMVSGGKDSTVITDLAIKSAVKCRFQTSWTGIEYPETVYFLRQEKDRIERMGYNFEFIIPRDKNGKQLTMWKLIEKNGYPTRTMRFCCERLKEVAGKNSYCILGVRWAESTKRKNTRYVHEISGHVLMTNNDNEATRRLNENCMKKQKYMLNPIIDWSDEDVWEYIKSENLPYNPLYNKGFSRVGCIGCPMRSNKIELEQNPRYAALYKRAGEKFLLNRANSRTGNKRDIESYFNWWVNFCSGHSRYNNNEDNSLFLQEEGIAIK